MATWNLTKGQIEKIAQYAGSVNKSNARVKMIPDIRSGILLGISVRFATPRSWREDTEKNRKIEKSIYDEIKERSHYRLLPEESNLIRRGVLELKYSSVFREANEWLVIETMKFIANEMPKLIFGEKDCD